MASHGDDGPYHPVDAVNAGIKGAMITGAAGLFAAAVKNATAKTNHGAMGVFTKSGGLIFTFSTLVLTTRNGRWNSLRISLTCFCSAI